MQDSREVGFPFLDLTDEKRKELSLEVRELRNTVKLVESGLLLKSPEELTRMRNRITEIDNWLQPREYGARP